jgi:hypothetical protein
MTVSCCARVRVQSKIDGLSGVDGHQIIHTPPYSHDATPIERVWMIGKQFAAVVNSGSRKPEQLRSDLLEGFYGGDRCAGVTRDNMTNFIRSADDCATNWIRENALLRAAFAPGTAQAKMHVRAFGAAERQRYRAQNTLIVTFDGDTDSSASSESDSDDGSAVATAPAAAAEPAAAAACSGQKY